MSEFDSYEKQELTEEVVYEVPKPTTIEQIIEKTGASTWAVMLSLLFNLYLIALLNKITESKPYTTDEYVLLIDGQMMSESDLLRELEFGNPDNLFKSKLFFNNELLILVEKHGQEKAEELYEVAKSRYGNLIKILRKMKEEGAIKEDVFNELLKYSGEWDDNHPYVIDLLYYGKGSCKAVAKLFTMALEEVYGDEIEIKAEVVNNVDRKTGKARGHIRTVIKDEMKHYVLEGNEVQQLTEEEVKKRDIHSDDIFEKAILANRGKHTFKKKPGTPSGTDFAPSPNINDGFNFPSTNKNAITSGETITKSPKPIFDLDYVDAYLIPVDVPYTLTMDGIKEGQYDYSHVTHLTDPKVAYALVDDSENSLLLLDGLEKITIPVLGVLSEHKGRIVLKLKKLDAAKVGILSTFKAETLSLILDKAPTVMDIQGLEEFNNSLSLQVPDLVNDDVLKEIVGIDTDTLNLYKQPTEFECKHKMYGHGVNRNISIFTKTGFSKNAYKIIKNFKGSVLNFDFDMELTPKDAKYLEELDSLKVLNFRFTNSFHPEVAKSLSKVKVKYLTIHHDGWTEVGNIGMWLGQSNAKSLRLGLHGPMDMELLVGIDNFKGKRLILDIDDRFEPSNTSSLERFKIYDDSLSEDVAYSLSKSNTKNLYISLDGALRGSAIMELAKYSGEKFEIYLKEPLVGPGIALFGESKANELTISFETKKSLITDLDLAAVRGLSKFKGERLKLFITRSGKNKSLKLSEIEKIDKAYKNFIEQIKTNYSGELAYSSFIDE